MIFNGALAGRNGERTNISSPSSSSGPPAGPGRAPLCQQVAPARLPLHSLALSILWPAIDGEAPGGPLEICNLNFKFQLESSLELGEHETGLLLAAICLILSSFARPTRLGGG